MVHISCDRETVGSKQAVKLPLRHHLVVCSCVSWVVQWHLKMLHLNSIGNWVEVEVSQMIGEGKSIVWPSTFKVTHELVACTSQCHGREASKNGSALRRSGCLGSTLAVMKKSSKLLPVIGWSMWFSEYLFLERSWAKDESTLKVSIIMLPFSKLQFSFHLFITLLSLERLKDYPQLFWLALFV
ncbi:hypothetical protein LXL04_026670 [Taraxacum kok-saghyz]